MEALKRNIHWIIYISLISGLVIFSVINGSF